MEPVVYYRLVSDNNNFIGFKRVIIEYLPAGSNQWQFKPLNSNNLENIKIHQPPACISDTKRARIRK